MNYFEMTDEALAIHDREVTVAREATDRPHAFGGIDGRCFDCDVRPHSRHAAEPCLPW